jgi:glycosyltransferase involved in cell wall biosynthesis
MKMLSKITPVILTYNEVPNICRTLDMLNWATDIIVVDSFSTDGTVKLIKKYPQVRLFQRVFDTHANQWNFAINETGVKTEWVLALDAGYVLTGDFVKELGGMELNSGTEAYKTNFRYCILGETLSGTLYPPVTVLYKREKASYIQDGHTQRVQIDGNIGFFQAVILHDDRRPLSGWLQAQGKYTHLEAVWLSNKKWSELGAADKLRKLIFVAPVVTFFYCLFVKRGLFDGGAGLYYAIQRTVAEALLSLYLLELRSIKKKED